MSNYDIFLQAIQQKKVVQAQVNTLSKGIIIRKCIPFDYGTGRGLKKGEQGFHFLDLDSPDGRHNLPVEPERLLSIQLLNEIFDPADYVTWTPTWQVKRDWGKYS